MRDYDESRDLAAVQRTWREVGWIDADSETEAAALQKMFSVGDALVADLAGEAECAVHATPGTWRHTGTDLRLWAVTAVTTSRVARRQGLASDLVTESLARAHERGFPLAALGMFEQGYYNRFGFGTGSYNLRPSFDPSDLTVPLPTRPPVRVTSDDVADVHRLLRRRHRCHGSVTLDPQATIEAELGWIDKPWGLGFRADDGRLTSLVYGPAEAEHGPYRVDWMAYETTDDLLELFGLLRSLGDQVMAVTLSFEPAELQVQDLLRRPIRVASGVPMRDRLLPSNWAMAWWQLRILDLRACFEALQAARPVEFGLVLHDPLADRGGRWSGVGGEYTVSLGEGSSVSDGLRAGVPVLEASVNALSRLWAGVRPATSLALTDDLTGPEELLADLDDAIRLPAPQPGWFF